MGIGPIKAQLLILKESKLREGPISKHTNGKDGIKVHAGEIDLNGDGECGGEETFRGIQIPIRASLEEEIINVSLGENDMWPSENAKEEEGGLILQTKLEKLIGCGALNYARDPGDVTVEATILTSTDLMPKIYQNCVTGNAEDLPEEVLAKNKVLISAIGT
ncbi:hypothetical protein AtNW77_Chr1g0002241 [Arabidopsis thaliana]